MTNPVSRVTDEKIEEMLAGLNGVTPGPWYRMEGGDDMFIVGRPEIEWHDHLEDIRLALTAALRSDQK